MNLWATLFLNEEIIVRLIESNPFFLIVFLSIFDFNLNCVYMYITTYMYCYNQPAEYYTWK